ncbi:unnamed protein product, partial [Closterium sp. NIES-54]
MRDSVLPHCLAARHITSTSPPLCSLLPCPQALEEAAQQAREAQAGRQKAEAAAEEERAAAAAAVEGQQSAEQRLREAQARVELLQGEVVSLKEVAASKDSLLAAVKEETMRNADMLLAAANTRKELAGAEARVAALQGSVVALEAEVRQQDQLLNEIRADAVSSADALRTAAQINQVGGRVARINQVGSRMARINQVAGRVARINQVGGRVARINRVGGRVARIKQVGGRVARINQ